MQVIDPSDPNGKLNGVVAIAASTNHSLAVKENGTVWAWGANNWVQLADDTLEKKNTPTQVPGLTDIASVGAGNGHSLAIGDPPSIVWAWGQLVRPVERWNLRAAYHPGAGRVSPGRTPTVDSHRSLLYCARPHLRLLLMTQPYSA